MLKAWCSASATLSHTLRRRSTLNLTLKQSRNQVRWKRCLTWKSKEMSRSPKTLLWRSRLWINVYLHQLGLTRGLQSCRLSEGKNRNKGIIPSKIPLMVLSVSQMTQYNVKLKSKALPKSSRQGSSTLKSSTVVDLLVFLRQSLNLPLSFKSSSYLKENPKNNQSCFHPMTFTQAHSCSKYRFLQVIRRSPLSKSQGP